MSVVLSENLTLLLHKRYLISDWITTTKMLLFVILITLEVFKGIQAWAASLE